MWNAVYECNNLVKNSGVNYDAVIRTRFDLLFNSPIYLDSIAFPLGYVCIPNNHQQWGIFRGYEGEVANDQFAIGTPQTMDIYSSLIKRLDHIILAEVDSPKPTCSEAILYTHLRNNRILTQHLSIMPYWNLIRNNNGTLIDNHNNIIEENK